MDDCVFCKIVKGEIPCMKLHETKDFLAFMDIKPVSLGHCLAIPKIHCENILDFPKAEEQDFVEFVKQVATAARDGAGADGFNLGMNNGAAAGQVVFHAHLHIIPRFSGDSLHMWPPRKDITSDDIEAMQGKIAKKIKK